MEKIKKINNQIAFSNKEIDKLFPFTFSLNDKLEITFFGSSLQKIIKTLKIEKTKFFDIFNIVNIPIKKKDGIKKLKSIASKLVLLTIRGHEKILFKGQFEIRENIDILTFFGTLYIDEYEKMTDLGLIQTDFPTYNPNLDIQQVNSALKIEQENNRNLKNELCIINQSITPVKSDENKNNNIVCVIRDINEQLEDIEKIKNLASFPNENPNPIFRLDKVGNILFCNKAGSELKKINFINKEYTIKKFWNYIFSDKYTNRKNKIDTLSNNQNIQFNIVKRKENEQFNVYGTDVTLSENYRNQIKESEDRFQLITESMPIMIWVSNENNIVTYTNQGSRDFFGFDLKNVRSAQEFAAYVHPDYRNIAVEDWAIHIKERRKCDVQYLAKNKNGDYRWIYEIAVPRFLSNNEFVGYIGCGFDITSERKMFNTLEEEKRKYELLSNQSADIIFLMNNTGIIEYASPSLKRILGFEERSIVGKSFFDLIDKSNTLSIKDFTNKNDKLKTNVLSFQIIDSLSKLKWVEASYNSFKENDLGGDKIIIHLRDINEQYIAQAMLIENEAKYRNLFSNMNLGIMEVDIDERIQYVNPAFERISGYVVHELVGKLAPELFLQDLSEKEINLQERRNREHGKEGLYEIKIKRKNGVEATWVISGAPIFDMKGKMRGSVGIHWDVTEIRDLETKILYESVQKEKYLMEAKLQAEEDQRDMIGRDLHDGVGQMLAYLSVYMNILKEKSEINFDDIEKAQSTIGKTIDEVRRLSRNLAPPAIKDLGFRDAVVELIGSYSIIPKPAFSLKIYKGKDPHALLYEYKLMFFRVIQELSSNTFKYAKANKVDLKIEYDANEMRLFYKDDGVGFDIKTVKRGIGLKSILSRVEFYGGEVKIKTKLNQGTEVIINLPFEQKL